MDEEKPRKGICYRAKDERIEPVRKLRKVERERKRKRENVMKVKRDEKISGRERDLNKKCGEERYRD